MTTPQVSRSRATSQPHLQPPGPRSPISNRTFLNVKAKDLNAVATLIDPEHSGALVTGKTSAIALNRFRREFRSTPVLYDAAEYERCTATTQHPFSIDDGALISSLDSRLNIQLDNGASMAITPTCFIAENDRDVLREVVSQTAELGRKDTLCLLPLDAKWLKDSNCDELIAVLAEYPIPTALVLGHRANPLETRIAKRGLRRLLEAIPLLSLFRTDLAAFDVMSHGGMAASIGIRSSLRHFPPPDSGGFGNNENDDKSHHVLVPQLLQWIKGRKLADDLIGEPSLFCECPTCDGDSLKRFIGTDMDTKKLAELHAVACWMPMVAELALITPPNERIIWWQERCADAAATGQSWKSQFGLSAELSGSIRFWAERS